MIFCTIFWIKQVVKSTAKKVKKIIWNGENIALLTYTHYTVLLYFTLIAKQQWMEDKHWKGDMHACMHRWLNRDAGTFIIRIIDLFQHIWSNHVGSTLAELLSDEIMQLHENCSSSLLNLRIEVHKISLLDIPISLCTIEVHKIS